MNTDSLKINMDHPDLTPNLDIFASMTETKEIQNFKESEAPVNHIENLGQIILKRINGDVNTPKKRIFGSTGVHGTTGVRGYTGYQGSTGVRGITGCYGSNVFFGCTGVEGPTRDDSSGNRSWGYSGTHDYRQVFKRPDFTESVVETSDGFRVTTRVGRIHGGY